MPLHDPVFTLLFLPGVLLLYALVRRLVPGWSAAGLLVASLAFYALGDLIHLPLILALVAMNYGIGRVLCAGGSDRRLNALLAAGIVLDVGVLAGAKFGFAPSPMMALESRAVEFTSGTMPLGLSLFVLQQITWLVEIRRKSAVRVPALGPIRFGLYAIFFPQMVAGPILQYPQASDQFANLGRVAIDRAEVARGLSIFIVGLAKKTLLADPIGRVADLLFNAVAAGHAPTFLEAWTAGWAYLLQLYFDFSGLSDMALGIGLMVGLRLPINFNSPLKARGASECFDRWHMSLTTFVRKYVFTPIFGWFRRHASGSATRRTIVAWAAATILSLSLVGWWHGTRPTLLLSGFLIGVISVALQLRETAFPQVGGRTKRRGAFWGRLGIAVGLLTFGIFFRAADLATAGRLLVALIQPWHMSVGTRAALMLPEFLRGQVGNGGFFPRTGLPSQFGLAMLAVASLLVYLTPNTLQIFRLWDHPGAPARESEPARIDWQTSPAWAICLGLLLTCAIVASVSGEARAALYGRF